MTPVLQARGLVKRYGKVTAINGADFDLEPGEVLAVVGDNGAGKSSLIKALSGALIPDEGEIRIDGEVVRLSGPLDARRHGIETVYQNLALAPAQDIASNLFLGRERRRAGVLGSVFRLLDTKGMRAEAARVLGELGIGISSMTQAVETLSGGQRQGVAVARAAAFGNRVVIMDEPTAALGVAESGKVLELINRIRERGLPVVLISHNMPHVFDIADRVHVHRLGKRVALVSPRERTMNEVVGLITGALRIDENGQLAEVAHAVTTGLRTGETGT
ncbi:ATP-binding cassette domain-containing protein [Crossiella cryophila]|uniref:Fructose transport system ATP-binding protein n=1 Tax=Crossiella cryophila TaxID=43355 RepID=A0A7W7C7S5_9PSEU|nr:ATP-binding cassette domain-containing protein [Crossiella cryophila]MBB4674823.1 fructose transport system ATP-binding protein [Crossiella cryophila]